MDYAALYTEITTDPQNRGYAAMTADEVAADLKVEYMPLNRSSMTGDEVFAATAIGDWNGLTDAGKAQWLAFCGRQTIDPFGTANVAFLQSLFGVSSATGTALGGLRVETVSRETYLRLGTVLAGDVEEVRG